MALYFKEGNSAAGNIASSVASGLDALIQAKTNKLQKQHDYQKKLSGLQALDIPNAEKLAHLDDKSLQYLIKSKLEEPSRQAYAQSLQSLLGGESVPEMQQQQAAPGEQETPFTRESITPEERQALSEYLKSPMAQQSMKADDILKAQKFIAEPQTEPAAQKKMASVIKPQLNEKQTTELAKLGLKKKQLDTKERMDLYKATKEGSDKIRKEASDAKTILEDLDRLEELESELDTPGYSEFLHRSGLDIPALMNPGSEEFRKIQNNFLRFAKDYYGGRVTNQEMTQFLQTIPSLSQSPEGRKRVIANFRRLNRLKVSADKERRKIAKRNGGVLPLDWQDEVDDALEKERSKITEMFKKDLAKPVPKGQNQLVTALQAAGGSILGGAGPVIKAAAPAVLGGLAGGPTGALAGGGLAALRGL